jgi:hypothetical protein
METPAKKSFFSEDSGEIGRRIDEGMNATIKTAERRPAE